MHKIIHKIVGRFTERPSNFYIKYNKTEIISTKKFLGIPYNVKYADEIIYQTPLGEQSYSKLFTNIWVANLTNEQSIYKKIEINPIDHQVYYKPHFFTRKRPFDCLDLNKKIFNSNEAMIFHIKYHINDYQLLLQPREFLYANIYI